MKNNHLVYCFDNNNTFLDLEDHVQVCITSYTIIHYFRRLMYVFKCNSVRYLNYRLNNSFLLKLS